MLRCKRCGKEVPRISQFVVVVVVVVVFFCKGEGRGGWGKMWCYCNIHMIDVHRMAERRSFWKLYWTPATHQKMNQWTPCFGNWVIPDITIPSAEVARSTLSFGIWKEEKSTILFKPVFTLRSVCFYWFGMRQADLKMWPNCTLGL